MIFALCLIYGEARDDTSNLEKYQSLTSGLKHIDLFANIGVFSGALEMRWYSDFEQLQGNIAYLKEQGIPFRYYSCPGLHEWTVWRKSVKEFLQIIF